MKVLRLLLLLVPSMLSAQSVRGVVTRGSAPLSGVVIQLLDSTSAVAARSLSDDRGVFRLLAPRPGLYRLSARRIGFVPVVSPPFAVDAGETVDHNIALDGIALSLDTVRVRVDRSVCGKINSANAEVAMVWEQARTALMATEATMAGRSMSTSLLRYQRTQEADGRQTLQSLSLLDVDSVSQPWMSPPAQELARTGYVVSQKDTTSFRAPGLDVLISDEFAASYCFRVAKETDSANVVLSFEPARPKRNVSELRGTLTLDRRSAQLRTLAFRYTNILAALDKAGAGGRMEFVSLRDGSWAIGRWLIRMPIPGPRVLTTRRGLVSLGPEVASVELGGGDLLVARRGSDTLYTKTLPVVAGMVVDSSTGNAIVGSRLRLRDTDRSTTTDSAGRFEFRQLSPGDYSMLINTPSLDSLGALTSVPLLVADTMASLTVRVPSARRVLPMVCQVSPDSSAQRGVIGVLRGAVRLGGETAAAAPIEIAVQWRDSTSQSTYTLHAHADERGQYRVCNVPLGTALDVRAESGVASARTPARVESAAPFARLDLTLEQLAPNTVVVRGEVLDATGNPLDNVTVQVEGQPLSAVTDGAGRYRIANVPAGAQRVTARRLGFVLTEAKLVAPPGVIVEQKFTLLRVTTLGEVKTTASRAWLRDFEESKKLGLGQFLTREQLEKQERQQLGQILAVFHGVRMIKGTTVSTSRGDRSMSSPTACFAKVYLDDNPIYLGRPGESPPNINQFLTSQLEALEYYAGPAETPAKYNNLNVSCGLIVLHTR